MAAPEMTLQLRRNEDRRIRRGHQWVYSNEVDTGSTPLKAFTAGQTAVLVDCRGVALGRVHVNPNALICARILDNNPAAVCDYDWFLRRLRKALALRQRFYRAPFYRLVYGDSDGMSGLVVDRYGDYLIVQCNSAGMDREIETICDALEALLTPRGILLRNDSTLRALEALPSVVEVSRGEVPDSIELIENDTRFNMAPASGQKTGWFFDHRENRRRLALLASDQRVLDVFSYVGGWGVQAAKAGASEVHCLDSSKPALELLAANAELNGVANLVQCLQGDATAVMRNLKEAGEKFDIVVLDPPALIRRRKDIRVGESAYRRLNREAVRLLNNDGLLVSASCSVHLSEDRHLDIVRDAAQRAGRFAQIVDRGNQSADHPVHPAMSETRYLKSLFCRIVA